MQIIVLGMHRSGTSALAGMLNLMGSYFGPENSSIGSNQENLLGFWERKDIRLLNDLLLFSMNCDWDRISKFDHGLIDQETISIFNNRAKNIVDSMNGYQPWFIKEPRMCLTLPIWQQFFSSPIYIICHRNPLHVARSLKIRNNIEAQVSYALWESYVMNSLKWTKNQPRIIVKSEELINDPSKTLCTLLDKLVGFGVTGLRMPSQKELNIFVQPKIFNDDALKNLNENHQLTAHQLMICEALASEDNRILQTSGDFIISTDSALLLKKHDKLKPKSASLSDAQKELLNYTQAGRSNSSMLKNISFADEAKTLRKIQSELKSIKSSLEQIKSEQKTFGSSLQQIKSEQKTFGSSLQQIKSEQKTFGSSLQQMKSEQKTFGSSLQQIKSEQKTFGSSLQQIKSEQKTFEYNFWKTAKHWWWFWEVTGKVVDMSRQRLKFVLKIISPKKILKNSPNTRKKINANKTIKPMKTIESVEFNKTNLNYLSLIENFGKKRISIIIPVYNAPAEVSDCINSVVDELGESHKFEINIIDDASTDSKIKQILGKWEGKVSNLHVHYNETNLGFTRTVNKGILMAKNNDIILLNSDTIITKKSILNLSITAYLDSSIGTVTSLSNNAGPFSIPNIGEENIIPSIGQDKVGYLLSQFNNRKLGYYFETPTGHGFCMYIKSACINTTGLLDDEAFPQGYGEENDFCMRARELGWLNVVSTRSYIYHKRNASFKERKNELIKAGRKIIDERYPNYTKQIKEFLKSKEIRELHDHASGIFSTSSKINIRPRILFVIPSLSKKGGTPQTNIDLMNAIEQEFEVYILTSDINTQRLDKIESGVEIHMKTFNMQQQIEPFPHTTIEANKIFASILWEYSIDIVHIRHILLQSTLITRVAKSLHVPTILSFHDFYVVCPSLKLLDENNKYCAGKCTDTYGECIYDVWNKKISTTDSPKLKNYAVHEWREIMRSFIKSVDAYVTTSESSKNIIETTFPLEFKDNPIKIIPHGRDFHKFIRPNTIYDLNQRRIKILVPGAISDAKGAVFLENLAQRTNDFAEFHVLGIISKRHVNRASNIYTHGEYERANFVEKVQAIGPDIGAIFSIWPETYCHTLTELLASGLPVLGFDIGAVGERITSNDVGWAIPVNDLNQAISTLSMIRENGFNLNLKNENVRLWQEFEGKQRNINWMASKYISLYKEYLKKVRVL